MHGEMYFLRLQVEIQPQVCFASRAISKINFLKRVLLYLRVSFDCDHTFTVLQFRFVLQLSIESSL